MLSDGEMQFQSSLTVTAQLPE